MTKELREKLAALRAVAPQLNAVTDEASAIVQAVDKLLGDELGIGITVESSAFESHEHHDCEGASTRVVFTLAYGRVGGHYRIHVIEETGELDDEGNWLHSIGSEVTAWSSCPRETKLKSFKKLPELLGLIADQATKIVSESRETSETVHDLMDALGAEVAPPKSSTPGLDAQKRAREDGVKVHAVVTKESDHMRRVRNLTGRDQS